MRHNPGKMKLEIQSVSSSKSSQLIFRFNLGRGVNDQTSNNPEMVRVQPYVSHGYKIQVEYPKVRKTATPNPHAVSAFPQPRAKKAWPFSQSRSVCALSCLCTTASLGCVRAKAGCVDFSNSSIQIQLPEFDKIRSTSTATVR